MTTKKLKITVGEKTYNVSVEILDEGPQAASQLVRPNIQAAPAYIAPAAAPIAPPVQAGGAGVVPAPLAGNVISIDVNVGDMLQVEQKVITLEAMKMETAVFTPVAGKVIEVYVKRGDAVVEGQPLFKIG